jgi:hypothetical protein
VCVVDERGRIVEGRRIGTTRRGSGRCAPGCCGSGRAGSARAARRAPDRAAAGWRPGGGRGASQPSHGEPVRYSIAGGKSDSLDSFFEGAVRATAARATGRRPPPVAANARAQPPAAAWPSRTRRTDGDPADGARWLESIAQFRRKRTTTPSTHLDGGAGTGRRGHASCNGPHTRRFAGAPMNTP